LFLLSNLSEPPLFVPCPWNKEAEGNRLACEKTNQMILHNRESRPVRVRVNAMLLGFGLCAMGHGLCVGYVPERERKQFVYVPGKHEHNGLKTRTQQK
jgi:hypothetical protein